ncbi:MAG: hypothetical protein CMF50_04575 [Legionellales bacterium]|nr:hypothetical protein [Legionellales bacterium]|tara:strand:+ start:2043 stop:4679 length:2637 start_codon:yes stop_codon:yes gene_type:complete
MFTELIEKLTPASLVLTANQRLATTLGLRYQQQQIASGETTWETPNILAYSTWLEQCYLDCLTQGHLQAYLLSTQQSLTVWENIIRQSPQGQGLLRVKSTAKSVQQAWGLIQQWQLQDKLLACHDETDTHALLAWTETYQHYCEQHQFIDPAMLTARLIHAIEQQHLHLPQQIYFIGFTELNPQQQHLITALRERGIDCEYVEPSQQTPEPSVIPCANSDSEFKLMAAWAAREHLQNPAQTIACVVPNLNAVRPQVKRIFTETFKRAGIDPETVNISGGQPLGNYNLIHTARLLLKLCQHPLAINDIGILLRSPYLAEAEQELGPRALLDRQLRADNISQLSLTQLLSISTRYDKTPALAAGLNALAECKAKLQGNHSPYQWQKHICDLLVAAGWPGPRSLNSEEYQLVDKWQQLLEQTSRDDIITPTLGYRDYLHLLNQYIDDCLFQKKTDSLAVQVLGILEATGIPFSQIWVSNNHDEAWPAPVQPNPFLPLQLQKQLGLPHASYERELQFAQRLTQFFCQHAECAVYFSYPQQEDDRSLSPSPLVKQMTITHAEDLKLHIDKPLVNDIRTATLETLDDNQGPPITQTYVKGGSGILKSQAACPFKAFAEYRLHAQTIETPSVALTYLDRGILTHDILEAVWEKLRTHAALVACSDEDLYDLLEDITDAKICETMSYDRQATQSRFLHIEKQRLITLLFNWLNYEKQREPFTVAATEERMRTEIGPLQIDLQVDRVDKLADGDFVLIDYKTGKPNIQQWFSDHPEDPQLPLYSFAIDKSLSGLAFAQVRNDEMSFKGITVSEDILPDALSFEAVKAVDKADSWHSQLQTWQANLTELAEDFADGYAAVTPANPMKSCAYCQLHSVCRINTDEVNDD